jgi:hypothetical protein
VEKSTPRDIVAVDGLKLLDPGRATLLHNVTCVYCGKEIDKTNSNKEHVIGRRFVPRGSLVRSWNLIVRACVPCNVRKSDLEDDLSAVTMQADSFGRYPAADPDLVKEAARKAARSISRRTGKPVRQSAVTLSVQSSPVSGLSISATLVAPAQPDASRAAELARMQLAALFYWVTFDPSARTGRFWSGDFFILNAALRGDWGNPHQTQFASAVQHWEPRVAVHGAASGYYGAIIRRHPRAACWSWALEWNRNYRLTGFFGERVAVDAFAQDLPPLKTQVLSSDDRRTTRMRLECELPENEDLLFRCDCEPGSPGGTGVAT